MSKNLIFSCAFALVVLFQSTSAYSVHSRNGRTGRHLLHHLRKRPDFHLGVAVRAEQLARIGKEDDLHCIMPNMNMGVPEYEMKWDPIEKNGPGQYDWSGTDKIAAWLNQNNRTFRGHCGVWEQATPGWVQQLDGEQHKNDLAKALYDHVYAVVHRYGKQMHSFDVVNEPFDYYKSGEFKSHDMVRIAFNAADDARRHIGSKVKLYINEFNVEGDDHANVKKRTALLGLIDWMQKNNIPLDGVGLQGHFEVTNFPKNLPGVLKQFTSRGLEVGFTEVDIRRRNEDNSEATLYEQAKQYGIIYETCLSNPKCVMVVRWNFDDDHSWIPNNNPGWGSATVFGSKCKPKGAILNEIIKVLDHY